MDWMAAMAAPVIGSAFGSLMGNNQTAQGVNPVSQLPGQAAMGDTLNSATNGFMGQANQFYGMNPGYANTSFNSMYNNPYAQGMQTAAGQAGTMSGALAPQATAAGQGTMAAGQQALGAGQQIWNTAQDPQNALFNQMQNQVQNQSNVMNSQYGLGASGAGAGVANQNMTNFDINWQNQQLARQMQGQQALNAGVGAYTGANNAGLNMGQTGIGLQQQAGALPYQVAQGIGQNQMAAIGQNQAAMQGALQPYQQNIGNMQQYLGIGQSQQNQANQQAYQQQLLQNQAIGNISNLAYQGLNSYFGGGKTLTNNPTVTSTPIP